MAFNELKDLYIDQLQDLYSADRQALEATRKMASEAHNGVLRDALERGVEGIERGRDTVGDIVKSHGADPTDEFCKGMQGLVREVDAHVFDASYGDDDVRDASIITQYQRMTHYGLAGYGCVVAFAKRLGLDDDAEKLQQCLDQTYDGDRQMTSIAMGEVNKDAA